MPSESTEGQVKRLRHRVATDTPADALRESGWSGELSRIMGGIVFGTVIVAPPFWPGCASDGAADAVAWAVAVSRVACELAAAVGASPGTSCAAASAGRQTPARSASARGAFISWPRRKR